MVSAYGFLQRLLQASLAKERCLSGELMSLVVPFAKYGGDRKSRIKLLEQHLNLQELPPYHPGEYPREVIMLDLLDKALSFAVVKGFPLHEIPFFLSFYFSSLDTVASAHNSKEVPTVLTAMQIFKDVLIPDYASFLSPPFLLCSVDYIVKSVFQHFHLYQFFLTQSQPTDSTDLKLTVETLDKGVTALCEGISEEEWLKEKRLQELDAEYKRKLMKLEALATETAAQADAKLQQAYETELSKFADGPKKVTHKEISEVVDALSKAHVECSQMAVSQSLLKQDLAMNFQLDQLECLAPSMVTSKSVEVESREEIAGRSSSKSTARAQSKTSSREQSKTSSRGQSRSGLKK